MAELRLFGGFELRDDAGSVVELPSRKSEVLIAYLAVHAGVMQPRSRLAGLLWSTRGDEQARASLRQCLSALNKTLDREEVPSLSVTRESVALNIEPANVDVLEFERLARDEEPDNVLRSVDLYGGTFLDGIELRDPVAEEWLSSERERLRSLAIAALTRVIETHQGRHQTETVADCANRLLNLDPLQEAGYRVLMRLHAERGERGLAMRLFRDCCEALSTELNVAPDEETQRVYESIVSDSPAKSGTTGPESAAFPGTAVRYEVTEPAVIVLPFDISPPDTGQEYLTEAVTEDVITALTRFRELFVFGSRTSYAARARVLSAGQLYGELGARFVVSGSVRRLGERVRVTAQLIDSATGRQLWAENYDRDMRDLFLVQGEIVKLIVGTIVGTIVDRIEDSSRALAARKAAQDMVAHDYVLRGRAALGRFTREGMIEAREHFKRALEIEPDNAPARAGLARSYLVDYWVDWSPDPQAVLEQALDAAKDAVELDAADHGTHQTLSMCYLHNRQYDIAFVHIDKATTLNPHDFSGYCDKSWLLALSGKPEDGVRCSVEGLRRNPFARGTCLMNAGVAHYSAGYYADAVREFSECMSFQLWRLAGLAASYAQLGEPELARKTADEFLRYAKGELDFVVADDGKAWLAYWQRIFPFKHSESFQHLLEGFRKAGVPT